MRLLFVTPEVTPYGTSSPIGDTCAALPKALAGRGHDVLVLSPLYGYIDPASRGLGRRLRKIEATLANDRRLAFTVFDTRTSAGVELMFLGQEELFAPVTAPSTRPSPEDGLRFGAFCKAAIEVLQKDDPGFDVVHCHGWQTALVPVLVDQLELELGTVLTVHDADALGLFSPRVIEELGLPGRLLDQDGLLVDGQASFLKGGLLEADRVTTISPTYAREVLASGRLAELVAHREDELAGIAGGVDSAVWNPATDAHLETRFDPMDLSGKARCKVGLQRDLGLPIRDDVPLIAVLGRLHPDTGLDALARIVSRVMRSDLQLAIIDEGPADEPLLAVLREHAKRWPDRMVVRADADRELMHRVLGGADCVVVPPRQAPGGGVELRAQRYGALPIGPRAGAVADAVVDCDAELLSGTGFLYEPGEDENLTGAIQRAVGAFTRRTAFDKARNRAMRADHSWERSAYLFERLYSQL